MTARLIVVHAGLHKTGTTSFQHWVNANRDRWPDDFAFFAKPHPAVQYLHECVEQAVRWGAGDMWLDVVKRAARGVAAEIPFDAQRVIVSLESLVGPMPDGKGGAHVYPHAGPLIAAAVAGLQRYGAEVQLALTTRNTAAWLQSVYSHQYRHGRTDETFAGFAETEQGRLIVRNGVGIIAWHIACASGVKTHSLLLGRPGSALLLAVGLRPNEFERWSEHPRLNVGVSRETFIAMQMPTIRRLPHFLRRRAIDWLERSPRLREFVAPTLEGSR